MQSTKDKIIRASLKLFNEQGVANVRLQQIADETGISVGNLAYHYKTKEHLVASIYEILFDDFKTILGNYLQQPSLLDFDGQIAHLFDFFSEYRFYISELIAAEAGNAEVQQQWQQCLNKLIIQIKNRLDFHVRLGHLRSESEETYRMLTENIWMSLVFGVPQQLIRRNELSKKNYKSAVWSLIKPYFTQQGIGEFELVAVNSWH